MDDMCFVVVDGITKSVTSPTNNISVIQLLQKRFPKSHCHAYDPFDGTRSLLTTENNTHALEELGRSLLQNVAQCRDCSAAYQGCQERESIGALSHSYRNMVFLGHDLGGSVIQNALILANEDSSYLQIAQATVAVVFFGTPHWAGGLFSWRRQIINLLAISQRELPGIFPSIQAFPVALDTILQRFTAISGSYAVLNVYEESDNATVPKESACLNSLVTEDFASQRRHIELLDLREDADPTTEWLFHTLGSLTADAYARNDEYHRFIRYLTRIEPKLHQLEARSSSPGSLNWITELDNFRMWNGAPGISFLHIFGPPGSGVTVLTSNIAWILNEEKPGQGICYLNFSFNKQDILASSLEKMLVCILRQLLSRRPHLFKHAQCLCAWIMQKGLVHLEVLWLLFESLLSHIGDEPVLIALRAILDCSSQDGHIAIIDKFLELRARIPNLQMKIIVTSETQDWARHYSEFFHDISIKTIDSVGAMLKGIVEHRVKRLVGSRPAWKELDGVITDKIWNEDQDFHLAMAKIQELETESHTILSTKAAMVNRLDDFPTETEAFFGRMVQKIPKESLAWLLEAICWVCFALRPMTSGELAVAIAFNEFNLADDTKPTFQVFEKTILSDLPGDMNRIAGYWVNVNGGRVEVINAALRSFLVNRYVSITSIHVKILTKCLKYLSWARMAFGTKDDGNEVKMPYSEIRFADRPACHLLEYAALYWPYHFDVAAELEREDVDMVQTFLEDKENLKFWSSIVRHYRPIGPSLDFSTSPLKAAATFGLTLLVERFLEEANLLSDGMADESSVVRETMDLAIQQGHTEVALKLCTKLQDLGSSPGLHKAAENGHVDLLQKFLLINSVNESVDHQDAFGYSPLHYAAQYGHKDAVSLLLQSGANANLITNDSLKSTALHLASKIGGLEVAQLLVNHGADHRICDIAGYNPLQLACMGGFLDLVTFLLPLHGGEEAGKDTTERSTTPLHLAATYGHTSICAHLIEQGATIKTFDKENQTAIHLAVAGNFYDTVKVLVDAGPVKTIDDVSSDGVSTLPSSSPLQLAAEKGHVDIVVLLLKSSYFYSNPSYDCNEALGRASAGGHWKTLDALLQYGLNTEKDPINSDGNSALHLACEKGHIKSVERLLESGRYDSSFRNKAGLASLHIASQNGHVQIVTTLLSKWTTVDCTSSDGDKAIHFAARHGHLAVVRALQQIRDMSTELDHMDKTPVLIAAEEGHSAIVDELLKSFNLEYGQSPDKEKMQTLLWRNSFPLHEAVASLNQGLCRILMKNGYNINTVNLKGDAPIHIAVERGARDMTTFLAKNGADLSAKNSDGETALFVAARMGDIEAVNIILEAADPRQTIELLDIPDVNGSTPLYIACVYENSHMVQLLLDKGADPKRRCSGGWTPLHKAAIRNNVEIMELLFNAGADHNIKNDYQSTPIILAAEAGAADAIRLLIQKGALANVINVSGSSALHRAAQYGSIECVKLLVGAGGELNAQKINGMTPLHLAIVHNHYDLVEYLLQCGTDVNLDHPVSLSPLEKALEHFDEDIVMLLVEAGATTRLHSETLSSLKKEAFLFVFQHPAAFIIESSVEALQAAIRLGVADTALTLIESATDINETGGTYHTALQAAAWQGNIDIIEKLFEKGADPNIFGGRFGSALHAAVAGAYAEAVALLLDRGADPSVKDGDGCPLLSYAIQYNRINVIDYLLSRSDISIHDTDLGLRTPLMIAVTFNKYHVIKRLLDKKADPNVQDSEGKSALIRAVTSSPLNLDIIRLLLEHQADPFLKDCRGRGVLYWACLRGGISDHSELMEMLLPRLRKEGESFLRGELALHAAASLVGDTTPFKQQLTLNALLQSGAEFDIAERDDDGWTASYTAMTFGFTAAEEAIMLHNFGRQPADPKKPTGWHRKDKAPSLNVSADGKSVAVGAPKNPDGSFLPRAAIRADHCMPGKGIYYFEITVDEDADEQEIGVGFCDQQAPLNRMLGWDPGSWGYHGDNGGAFSYTPSSGYPDEYGDTYGHGDTIGCGVNFEKETAFFTLNGKLIGPAFRGIKGKLYPAVCFSSERPVGKITAKFGPEGFLYGDWASDKNTEETQAEEGSDEDSDEDSDAEWEIWRRGL